jgi:hypothetical protein
VVSRRRRHAAWRVLRGALVHSQLPAAESNPSLSLTLAPGAVGASERDSSRKGGAQHLPRRSRKVSFWKKSGRMDAAGSDDHSSGSLLRTALAEQQFLDLKWVQGYDLLALPAEPPTPPLSLSPCQGPPLGAAQTRSTTSPRAPPPPLPAAGACGDRGESCAKVQLLLLTSRVCLYTPGFHLLILLLRFQVDAVFSISTQQRKTFVFAAASAADGHRERERGANNHLCVSRVVLSLLVMRSLALPRPRGHRHQRSMSPGADLRERKSRCEEQAENKSRTAEFLLRCNPLII